MAEKNWGTMVQALPSHGTSSETRMPDLREIATACFSLKLLRSSKPDAVTWLQYGMGLFQEKMTLCRKIALSAYERQILDVVAE